MVRAVVLYAEEPQPERRAQAGMLGDQAHGAFRAFLERP
jgi:hypothetical protein